MILLSWGCHNKVLQTGWLEATGFYSLVVLEAVSLESGCCRPRPILASMEEPWLLLWLLQLQEFRLWLCHSVSASISTGSPPLSV